MEYGDPSTADQSANPIRSPLGAGWGLSETILGLFIGLVASTIAAAIVLSAIGNTGLLTEAVQLAAETAGASRIDPMILVLIATDIVLIAVAVGYAWMRRDGGRIGFQLGFRRLPAGTASTIAAAYALYFVCAIAITAIASPDQQDLASGLGADGGAVAALIAGAGIILIAPLAEEVFFRGFLYGGLRNRLSVWPAIAVSALIFGLLHFDPEANANFAAALQLALLGGILAWLYERTGSIWAPIILHVTNNSLAFAIMLAT